MSNSKLVNYTKKSPNYSERTAKISKITIHHMAGNCSIEACGEIFAKAANQVSSNYGIGTDGRVALYVDEKYRSWCSSNRENDMMAITIEVANDGGSPNWHVSDKALSKLIDLCVDICLRNDIKRLNFTGDKSGNLTLHKFFKNTDCPGKYLESKMNYICKEVNDRLAINETYNPAVVEKQLYRVQVGAFSKAANAQNLANELKSKGYDAFVVNPTR